MKVIELRIGNYIHLDPDYLKDVVFKVITLEYYGLILDSYDKGCIKYSYSDYKIQPIKLTEEWLLNFGFETSAWDNYSTYRKMVGNNDYTIVFDEYLNTYVGDIKINEIKYVHQLQNLYFALTGKELNTKTEII